MNGGFWFAPGRWFLPKKNRKRFFLQKEAKTLFLSKINTMPL
jgi:hypothetical protein